MVRIAKRIFKGRSYYYLEHTIRNGDQRTTKSKYLGNELPKDLDKIKRKFLFELNKEKWFDDFEKIRRSHLVELKSIPKSSRQKSLYEFSIRFTYDTQRIEGSTLTLRETAQLLENKISPSGKPIEDAKEAEAHNKVFLEMIGLKRDLSQELIQDWHWKIFKETKPDIAGKIRRHGIRITGSRFVPPAPVELQPLLDEFFNWYDESKTKTNPVELAGQAHLKFVTVHPFVDGNGRIGRLLMNFILHRHGYPMLDIEHERRMTYYSSLERSQIKRDDRPFLNWFFKKYKLDHQKLLAILSYRRSKG
ncbi:MAG: Fic family protein [Thaumarchaeota archaeon]|nr:Fic family protein [Nitrososphaerota archaeon]